MTPRGTDWSLALLVSVVLVSGGLTAFAGAPGSRWVFTLHGMAAGALALVLVWKLRRVWRRLFDPSRWDPRTLAAAITVALVASGFATGWLWSTVGPLSVGGFRLLAWHWALGAVLIMPVAIHVAARAKPPRRRDVTDRRQFLVGTGVAAAAVGAWQLQRPFARVLGLRGDERRFTGSYEQASFEGNAFPATSWVADDPRVLDPAAWRLALPGGRRLTAAALDGGDELVATLDCTGGFFSTQRWGGTRLDRLLDGPGDHVRVISHTGYRWSFPRETAGGLLLATHVGGEPISHGHGAPARLVAPGRRGFQWVKWVVAIELHDGPDPGAALATVTSSFTAAGRGRG